MDTCRLTCLPGNGKLYQYDLYDPAGRFARTVFSSSATAASARGALERMPGEMPFPALGIHTDRGSEFRGAFEALLKKWGIRQQVIHPRTPSRTSKTDTVPPGCADPSPHPQQNAHVEHFHATVNGDWLQTWPAATAVGDLNQEAAVCIRHCNHRRPHQSLGGQTPAAFLLECYLKLLLRDP